MTWVQSEGLVVAISLPSYFFLFASSSCKQWLCALLTRQFCFPHAPALGFSQAVGSQELLTLGCPVSFTFQAQLCSSCTAQLAVMCLDVESSDTLNEMWSKVFKNSEFLQFLSGIYIFLVVQMRHRQVRTA